MRAERPAKLLVAAALGAVLGALALALRIASREWFTRDDFAFLAEVRRSGFSLAAAFWPAGERFWPFYRPLGMEGFFWLGSRLFGLDAFGYFALALALHFAAGALVLALARRLGFSPGVAWGVAALAVTRQPSLTELYAGNVFHYAALAFLALAAAWLFERGMRTGSRVASAGAATAFALALLCNEAALVLPGGLALLALGSGAARATPAGLARLARALAPELAIAAAWAVLRFGALAPAETSRLYEPALGTHLLPNAIALAARALGGVLAGAGVVAAAIAALGLRRGALDAGSARGLARAGVACLAWAALAALPFASLPFPQTRWAIALEAPLCLALGALLEAARRSLGPARARAFDAMLAACLLAAVPWSALATRAREPQGAAPRALVAALEAARPPLAEDAQIALLYGAPGLADAAQGAALRALCYGGGVLRAVAPGTRRVLRFVDLGRRTPRNALRADSVYLVLRPDGRIERAEPELLARELFRAIASGTRDPG